ncbi:hypothetical protein BUALT_Bualt03G0024500 [Buddleja alternifolia]|uniref:Uncharacterized protein n=1 Tax=Buddleja alternifolia TaxID=168488 RepID=A0AAV6Y1G2_9LAMI|nr:hypothetical protein BUALT_Bualt03G0024500 [Buddleja alternifolia]
MPNYQREEVDEKPHEKIIEIVVADDDKNRRKLVITKEKHDQEEINGNENFAKKKRKTGSMDVEVENEAVEVKKNEAKRVRSNSLMVAAAENEEKQVLQRTMSERHVDPRLDQENDQFSNMSDEELNRRVEDFIRRFNMQIRLQARQNLELY